MRRSRLLALLVVTGCLDSGFDDVDEPDVLRGAHFDYVRGPTPGEMAWYETYASELEAGFTSIQIPRIRIYSYELHSCPEPYCIEDSQIAVACAPRFGNCIQRLARAILDANRTMPLVLRDGLVEVLAGGIGHGDYFDIPLNREALDLASLLDDRVYLAAQEASPGEWGELAWVVGTLWPAADFVRFVLDVVGPDQALDLFGRASDASAWQRLGSLDEALAQWRVLPVRTGRMFRIPLAECSARSVIAPGHHQLPTHYKSLVFAPDLAIDEWLHRIGAARFEIVARSSVHVEVTSGVGGNAFFRVELCAGDTDPGRFAQLRNEARGITAAGEAVLGAGTYFVLVGSDGPDADVPEAVTLKVLPVP